MAGFGVSFVPGGGPGEQPQGQGGPEGQVSGAPPLQQAIRMLSLRLPKFSGPGGIAPQQLLQAPGAMGQPGLGGDGNTALIEALLRLARMGGGGSSGGGGQQGSGLNYPGGMSIAPPWAPPSQGANPLPKIGPGIQAPSPAPFPDNNPPGFVPGPSPGPSGVVSDLGPGPSPGMFKSPKWDMY